MSFFKSLGSNVISAALRLTGIIPDDDDDGESELDSVPALPTVNQLFHSSQRTGTSPQSRGILGEDREVSTSDYAGTCTQKGTQPDIASDTKDRLLQQDDEYDEDDSAWSQKTADLLRVSSSDSDSPNGRKIALQSHEKRAENRDLYVPNTTPAKPEDDRLFKSDGASHSKIPLKKFTSPPLLPVVGPSSSMPAGVDRPQSSNNSLMDASLSEADRFTQWITKDGGVRKMVDIKGEGEFPLESSTVKYLYKISRNVNFQLPLAYMMQKDTPTITKLSSTDIMVGMRIAVLAMQSGERAIFRIEPTYGYGMQSSHKLRISSREVIYLYVDLLEVTTMDLANRYLKSHESQRVEQFTDKEIEQAGIQLHVMGKEVFANGKYAEAAKYFCEALTARKLCDTPNHCQSQGNTIFACLENNAALSYLKEGNLPQAEEHGKKALELRATVASMAKACFILAKVANARSEWDEAVAYVKRGLVIAPQNPELTQLFKTYQKLATVAKEESRSVLEKCVSRIRSASSNEDGPLLLKNSTLNASAVDSSDRVSADSAATSSSESGEIKFSQRALSATMNPKDNGPKVMSRIEFLRQNRQIQQFRKVAGNEAPVIIGGKKRSFGASSMA